MRYAVIAPAAADLATRGRRADEQIQVLRAGRYGDGLQPLGVAGEELAALVAEMRSAAVAAGRDPDALELSLGHLVPRVDASSAERLGIVP